MYSDSSGSATPKRICPYKELDERHHVPIWLCKIWLAKVLLTHSDQHSTYENVMLDQTQNQFHLSFFCVLAMDKIDHSLSQEFCPNTNEKFSSNLLKVRNSSLAGEETNVQEREVFKKNSKDSHKPSFLRKIFACYVKDNKKKERKGDRGRNELDHCSSTQTGESNVPIAVGEKNINTTEIFTSQCC